MKFKDFWLFSNSNAVIHWFIIIIIIIAIIYLIVVSIIVRDLKYPREHFYLFALEVLLISICCSSITVLMAYNRGNIGLFIIPEFIFKFISFGLICILLQLSGFYSYIFNYKTS